MSSNSHYSHVVCWANYQLISGPYAGTGHGNIDFADRMVLRNDIPAVAAFAVNLKFAVTVEIFKSFFIFPKYTFLFSIQIFI